ncbi:hypothetical protein BAUCODRAFT_151481 [Baudoinia panamericana UAMH 10762]|uniref:Cytochrome P450 n=1 Tax=Baudoinia panamericana (strain UAMH 10762) TaxID=717646 RepID=M2M6X9_BAUPA|nr:uncharacterized protein BAUCODRAFT_151481 [Baudoinia panamericana UAMH 10762]EMC92021.1 hypothetical protein BAUCODRAFT_151481 [Baudoinia panamericana UAMH 10762]
MLYVAVPFLAVAILLSLFRLYTTWTYHHAMSQYASPNGTGKPVTPPQIPYTLPFLGNTLSFLSTKPGAYWQNLFAWHPRSTGVLTLLIGGRNFHILFAPQLVQAIFKARKPSRDAFDRDLYRQMFDMSTEQVELTEASKHMEHESNVAYLIRSERVNELTAKFTQVLREVLDRDIKETSGASDLGLYVWLRDRMFTASTIALMGEELLEMYPDYCRDFYVFDNAFLSFYFRIPNFLMRDAYEARARILRKLEAWSREMHRLSGGKPVDPEGPAWEPLFGSRLNRARHTDYTRRKLDWRSSACFDLGLTFAFASNIIPVTGWMLMHVLDPQGDTTLLPRVLEEIKASTKQDGTLNVPTLIAQPLLQCIWTEALRMYVDILVTRNLPEDITLPLDEEGKRQVLFRKGDNIFAPSWLGSHNPNSWSEKAPYHRFCPERFLFKNPETGKTIFSTLGTAAKLFPFGGGRTICPGRVFAKQEAIGALALILLRFEFEVVGYLDAEKKPTDAFPGFATAFPGSGGLVPGGDFQVKVRRRV